MTAAEVTHVERVLVEQNPQILRNAHITADEFRDTWVREYAGFTRGGVRYVYGSYGPVPGTGVCDGGPSFFGVEYEMPSGRVTHRAYNGMT